MKKFVAIYMAPTAAMNEMRKNASPEQMKGMMDSWKKWIDSHKESLVDVGAPLGKNMRVTKDNVTAVSNEINGFSVVQAESQEEAAKIFSDNPQLQMPGVYIEVLEWVEMPV